jgi:hypothetical protein
MIRVILIALVLGLTSIGASSAQSASGMLPVIVHGKLAVVFNPTSASITCDSPAGTVLSAVTTTGGNQKPITLTMTGDTTDFALSATAPPANVVVASAGITSSGSSCPTVTSAGITDTVTVTATQ